ncbi:MAG: hypothetical protein KDD89_09025 [Anaerolineales bacterium]|nr:hypothetical protein [Anaerolineales bacterium]
MNPFNQPQLEEIIATEMERVWANFDPSIPLKAGSDFYVNRPDEALRQLKKKLLMATRSGRIPKYYFSGHRGSGKSTEMNRLAADPEIREQFVVIHYSIREYADVYDLNHTDLLFTLGAQMFVQYTDPDGAYRGKLKPELFRELEGLHGRIIEKTHMSGKDVSLESQLGLKAYFLEALGKAKTEQSSRHEIRQILEPRSSEWIAQINLIAQNISANEHKQVLIIVDDLDKPNLDIAKTLFHDHIGVLQQPNFPIVYTVPIAIFFTHQMTEIREGRQFLPSIKLFTHDGRKVADNFSLMRQIVAARMDRRLIADEALDHIVEMSGGIVRDLTRMMQMAALEAILDDREQINLADARRASTELRNEFRDMLTQENLQVLRALADGQEIPSEEKAPLLFISAAVEYLNGKKWEAVHPVVKQLLNDG